MKINIASLIILIVGSLFATSAKAQATTKSYDSLTVDALTKLHERYRVAGLDQREFSPNELWAVLGPIIDRPGDPTREKVGHSAKGRPLYLVRYGHGPTQILLWSQMHGDESTATMALVDIFNFLTASPDHPLAQRIAEELTILAVPMLNPDGAKHFRRRNAQGIDINRDALRLATPEAETLKHIQQRFQPDFGFNLHDQNPRTRVGHTDRMAAIALLAPSYNEAQDDNASRLRAKHLAATIRQAIEPLVGGHITRYSADFNPIAFGDNMQKWGVSTVLIESGGWKNDPEKQYLRKVNFVALLTAFNSIAAGSYKTTDISAYSSLPMNGSGMYDLLIKGGTIIAPELSPYRADLLINYNNPIEQTDGYVTNVGHLAGYSTAIDTLNVSGLFIHLQRSLPDPPTDAPVIWDGMPAKLVVRRGPEPTSKAVWVMDGGVPYHPKDSNNNQQNQYQSEGMATAGSYAPPRKDNILQSKLETLVKDFKGRVGVYVHHLRTGATASVNAHSLFPTASLIKIPILLTVFQRIEDGVLDYRQTLTFRDSLRIDAPEDIIALFKDGAKIKLSEAVMLMLTVSDNTAALWLQQLIGRSVPASKRKEMDFWRRWGRGGLAVNNWLVEHGFKKTRSNSGVPRRKAAYERYGWGQTTPREMTEMLVRIRKGEAVSPAASNVMFRALTRTYVDGRALSQIPPTVQTISKQGWVRRSRSEVVLVNAPHGDYVFCVITAKQEDTRPTYDNAGYVVIRDISRLLWNYFEPTSNWQPLDSVKQYYD